MIMIALLLASVAQVLQPLKGQGHASALVVSVLDGDHPGDGEVGVIPSNLGLQLLQAEGAVLSVGQGPRVDAAQLGAAALLVHMYVGLVT